MNKYFIILIALFIFPFSVFADLGPKPTMDFEFENFPQDLKIIKSEQIQCEDRLCLWGNPLKDAGPQSFGCNEQFGCLSLAYGYSKYNKIEITLSNGKKLESNVFSQTGMNSEYTINFTSDGKIIINSINVSDNERNGKSSQENNYSTRFDGNEKMTSQFLKSFFLTVILESIVALIYVSIRKISRKTIGLVLLGNIISLPIFWFIDYKLYLSFPAYFFSEIIIVIFEAMFIKLVFKEISWKDIFILSLLMNIASLFLGEFILALV